ncbi:methyltransferase domain-containing protein [Alphaproteobacteria bacterium KMM 3653]|uniref:Methyltransferase domain-containing protein n=1 Tax=Harenicola maris TaxID=2841044 RepID=A0AAP2G8R5_9RHOB|nr:methyltransferase domain-containing protein [Harenicola maris]
MTDTTKLHLGCGVKHIPGWFHIDALPLDHVDHVGPVEDLSFIEDNTVELIYACHVLEHFGRKTYTEALAEWFRVLKPGGVLRIAVPDFNAAATLYKAGTLPNGIEGVRGLVCGGQRDQYDFHGMIFDEASLSEALKGLGFSETRLWDWRKTEHSDLDDYSQAYMPHMDKENGTLVSLNLEAVK